MSSHKAGAVVAFTLALLAALTLLSFGWNWRLADALARAPGWFLPGWPWW